MNQQVINRIMDQTFEDRTMSMLSVDKDVPVALRLRRMKRRLFLERTTSKGSVSESSTEEDSPSSQARRVSQSSLWADVKQSLSIQETLLAEEEMKRCIIRHYMKIDTFTANGLGFSMLWISRIVAGSNESLESLLSYTLEHVQ